MHQRVPPWLINLSSAVVERCGGGSPFIIEAETGLIWSQYLPLQHAPITNTTGAIATPLLLCNYSKERGKGKKIERGRGKKKWRYLEGITLLKSKSQSESKILTLPSLRRHISTILFPFSFDFCQGFPGRRTKRSLILKKLKIVKAPAVV